MDYAVDIFDDILKVIRKQKTTYNRISVDEYFSTDAGDLGDEEFDRVILNIPSENEKIAVISFNCKGKDGIWYGGLYGVYSYYEGFYRDGGSSWQFEGLVVNVKTELSTLSSVRELNANIAVLEDCKDDVTKICHEAEKLINTHTFVVPVVRTQKGTMKVIAVSKEDALEKFKAMSKEKKGKAFSPDVSEDYTPAADYIYQEN